MIKILHFVTDEKFIDIAMSEFCEFSKQTTNLFVFVTEDSEFRFKYIQSKNILLIHPNNVLSFLNKGQFNAVILHNFYSLPTSCLLKIKKDIKVIWFAWGFDIYGCGHIWPLIKIRKYRYHTKLLLFNWKSLIFDFIHLPRTIKENYIYRCGVKRVDYFSGVLPVEYSLMRRNCFFRAEEVCFSYIDPNRVLQFPTVDKTTINILLGNSSDPCNNHADILIKLANLGVNNCKIVVPLSYPTSMKNYAAKICDLGNKLMKDNFIGITSFLPIEEYNKAVRSCHVRIFPHERQQAIGNILLAFENGCKVFMSKTSINYSYFSNLGFHVYTIQDDLSIDNLVTPLDDENIEKNFRLLIKYKSWESVYKDIDSLIKSIEKSI